MTDLPHTEGFPVSGIEALTLDDRGNEVVPTSPDEWDDWVSASKTRNRAIQDPLLDWLDVHGEERGFERDDELPGYDPRCDFTRFIFDQARRFEDAVVEHLSAHTDVRTIARDVSDISRLETAIETVEAMRAGVPVIAQGVVRDPEHRVFGAPDLLVRSDHLPRLFPQACDFGNTALPAPGLGRASWHYRVIDIKYTTIQILAGGDLANQGSTPAYKTQLFLYARALARVQGTNTPASYLLGRGWKQTSQRGAGALERLGPLPPDGTLAGGRSVASAAEEACDWIRTVRREGAAWDVLPEPSRPELYPNLGNPKDGPWHAAKRRIAEALEDPTLVWQVGPSGRESAFEHGVRRWKDPACTPEVLGVGGSYRPTVEAILEINRTSDGPPVRPARVRAAEDRWRPEPELEFYVDFETVNDLWDDFSRFPDKGVPPLIFMIGCGHVEEGEWRFECFLADDLDESAEAGIIDAWFDHMEEVRRRLDSDDAPPLIHWSHAESTAFDKAYNSATQRHPDRDWPPTHWFDLWKEVFRAEPVVVRGAMGFGLKEVARALHSHGLIDTLWEDNSLDGLGAMTGAWRCYDEAARRDVPVESLDLMRDIVRYNEIDCRVLMEIMTLLRRAY